MLGKLCSNFSFKIFLTGISLIWFFLFAQTIQVPLQGTHQWRQADTLAPAYYFCIERNDILHPRVSPRQNTSGIAIGDFPLYAWIVGKWCQIKGSWDEVSPKVINMLIYFIAMGFWWIFLYNHYRLKNIHWYHWFALCFYSVPALSFLTIPMPEALALLFFGASGSLWTLAKNKTNRKILGAAAFTIGFLLRPYHIPFLVKFKPRPQYFISTLVICILLFGIWYKYWPSQATELHGHYAIGFESLNTLFKALPAALAILPVRLIEHTAGIGLLLFPLVLKKNILLVLLYFGSLMMMLALKATHLPSHAYYLMNAAFIALTIMLYGLDLLKSDTKRNIFLTIFVLFGVGNTVHNILPNKTQIQATKIIELAKNLPPEAKVTTYTGGSPHFLYWLKRTGWLAEPESFYGESSCPSGSDYYLIEDSDSYYRLGKCQ